MAKKFSFVDNRKNNRDLLTIFHIINSYNSLLYKYTQSWKGKIPNIKTDIENIPNKYINLNEYIKSKKIWVQILKFAKESNIINIDNYIDVMFRNWKDIAMFLNGSKMSIPKPQIVFSLKMLFKYEELSSKEIKSADINKHLNIKKGEDFYLLNKTIQHDINSLMNLKKMNTDLGFHDIINIFAGEFDAEFKEKILAIPEKDINENVLINL